MMNTENNEQVTEISSDNPETLAIQYVASAIIDDIDLLEKINKQNQLKAVMYAGLALAINNALTEVQTIGFLAKNRDEFYKINRKYIMIIGMYEEIMNEKLKQFTPAQLANHLLIDQQKQLFVIMLAKLFQTIKRADIYFEDQRHYTSFRHLLPVQMYYDNVIAPDLEKFYKKQNKQKKSNGKKK